MAARPRIRRRVNWPDNLHEPRPGYYTWRDPRDRKTHVLGRIPLQQAIYEAHEANLVVAQSIEEKTLAERISARKETIIDLIAKMPTAGLKPSTLKTRGYHDACIIQAMGNVPCAELTTKHVADLLESLIDEGKMTWARAIRTRLVAVGKRGMSLGWMTQNPAVMSERPKVKVKRRRLKFEEFQEIYERAPEVAPWLQNAMLLALVSGQDRSTIARLERSAIRNESMFVQRSKTSIKIEIPLALRMDAINMTLGDVVTKCRSTGIVSRYVLHHVRNEGRAVRGSHVKLGTISEAFKKARNLVGISDDTAPTFHEIRSLSKRLYDQQGNVDTKRLLGHMTDEMSELYANNRGLEPLKVTIG